MAESRALTPGWAGRLRDLLGTSPHALKITDVERLVERGVREDDQLDFKREPYGGSDKAKRDLAADLAALANHRGGLVLIGVAEQDGAACELVGAMLTDAEELRIREIAARLVQPYLAFDLIRVVGEGVELECYGLLVAPSPLAPHCVRKDDDLRYVRRNGTSTRHLTESEVADAYRSRFAQAEDERSRLNWALEDALSEVDTSAGPWLAAGLVPTQAAAMDELDTRELRRMEDWMGREFGGGDLLTGFLDGNLAPMRAGIGRVVLHDPYGGDKPRSHYAELHSDGVAVAAVQTGFRRTGDTEGPHFVMEQDLTWATARVLRVVTRHARDNAGATGDVLVELRLSAQAVALGHARFQQPEPVRGSRQLSGATISRRTLVVEELVESPAALMAAVRMLLTDLLHAFGVAGRDS